MVSSLRSSGRMLWSKLLVSRSPLFLVHSFSSAVFQERYFSRMWPLMAPHSLSVPFKTAVSTKPMPGVPSREQELYGWMRTQSASLPPCPPTWRALLCHMGNENTHHPSSDDLPTSNKLCFPLDILSHLWHDAHRALHSYSHLYCPLPWTIHICLYQNPSYV